MKKILNSAGVFSGLCLMVLGMLFAQPQHVVFADQTCSTASQTVVSDESSTYTQGTDTGHAVLTYTSPMWTAIPGASWIWKSYYVQNPSSGETVTFNKPFTLSGNSFSGSLSIAADDYFQVFVNGNQITNEVGEGNFLAVKTYDVSPYLVSGSNVVTIEVTNAAYYYAGEGTATNNPGGVDFSLSVTSTSCSTTQNSAHPGAGYGYTANQANPTPAGVSAVNADNSNDAISLALAGTSQNDVSGTSSSISATDATSSNATGTVAAAQDSNMLASAITAVGFSKTLIYWCIALIILIIAYIIWLLIQKKHSVK